MVSPVATIVLQVVPNLTFLDVKVISLEAGSSTVSVIAVAEVIDGIAAVVNDAVSELKLFIVPVVIVPVALCKSTALKEPVNTSPLIISCTTTSVTCNWNPLPNVLGLVVLIVICASSLSKPPSLT